LAGTVLAGCRTVALLAGGAAGEKRNRRIDGGGQQEAPWPEYAFCCELEPRQAHQQAPNLVAFAKTNIDFLKTAKSTTGSSIRSQFPAQIDGL
jgi:hypothetical protein